MAEISEAAKRAKNRFFQAMNGTSPNYDICEIVQQAIDEATAEKDAEIERLRQLLSIAKDNLNGPHECNSAGCVICALVQAIDDALAGGEE